MIYQLITVPAIAWLIYSTICLIINIRRARTIGLPTIILPISPNNILWVLCEPFVLPIIDCLPFSFGNFRRYCNREWRYTEKYRPHLKLGDAWILVSPDANVLCLSNPEVVEELFLRRWDFKRPLHLYSKISDWGEHIPTLMKLNRGARHIRH